MSDMPVSPLQQAQLDRAIGQELLRCVPEGWTGVHLVARRREGSGDSWSLRISLTRRPSGPGAAVASSALEQRVAEMFAAHRKAASGLVEARYIVDGIGGAPSIISEFKYQD